MIDKYELIFQPIIAFFGLSIIDYHNYFLHLTGYPTLHSSPLVRMEVIANYSLLYEIKGTDDNLKPYMLCSHMDVVPVEESKWNYDPFAGVVEDGYIYGRGAVDVKDSLMVRTKRL